LLSLQHFYKEFRDFSQKITLLLMMTKFSIYDAICLDVIEGCAHKLLPENSTNCYFVIVVVPNNLNFFPFLFSRSFYLSISYSQTMVIKVNKDEKILFRLVYIFYFPLCNRWNLKNQL